MKRLLLLSLLLLPLTGSARIFPTQFEVKAVCFDNAAEAVEYHQDVLGEYPIGKGGVINKNGPTFVSVMFNPNKPSWTLLNFHQSNEGDVIVCAITGGTEWKIIHPGDEGEKLEL